MLLNFRFSNFMSFKDTTEFSMIPSKVKTHSNHIYKSRNMKEILSFSTIYGANASGKTNLVRAIRFMRDLVVHGIEPRQISQKYYRSKADYKNKASRFEIDLIIKNVLYTYGFEIMLSTGTILKEYLYSNENNEDTLLFSKVVSEDDVKITIEDIVTNQFSEKSNTRLNIYIDDFKASNNDLFIHFINSGNRQRFSEENNEKTSILNELFRWYDRKLEILLPETQASMTSIVLYEQNTREKLSEFLRKFGTGISKIETDPIEIREIDDVSQKLLEEIQNRVYKDLHNNNNEKKIGSLRTPDNIYYFSLNPKTNEIITERLYFKHENSDSRFILGEESDGTKRLIDLYNILNDTSKGKTYIVDELDRSLHPNLVYKFIEKKLKNPDSQLIITTHEDRLLDLSILRRDEIWFVEKNKSTSKLYSLEQFKVRNDKDILNDYLDGRYGSIPNIDYNLKALHAID